MPVPIATRPLPDRPTVVVLRALPGLGDWLCAVPTFRALRQARPEARIVLVGLAATRDLVGRFGAYIDEIRPLPGWPGLPEQRVAVREIPAFLAGIQALDADLAIQLHGAGDRTNELTELFGARAVAGFHRPGERCPDAARFLRWRDNDSEVRRGLRLLSLLGLPAEDEDLEFPLDPAAASSADAILADAGVEDRFVVIHPGANRPVARWSAAGFAEVGRAVAGLGARVVISGGTHEQALGAEVARGIPGAVDLTGRTDLDQLGWILGRAELLIANDTGVSHLAAALRVPSVVVFTDPAREHWDRWAPLDRALHRPVAGSAGQIVAEARRRLRVPTPSRPRTGARAA
jgi:ADP-heptose:LPS heptosyltransferase